MALGTALREAREQLGLRQIDLGHRVSLSGKMISLLETDRRQIARDLKPKVAKELDSPRLFIELANEATGGIGPVWLDGSKVDLHRVCVREKTIEELGEAIERLGNAKVLINARSPDDLTDTDRDQLQALLHDLVEGQTALAMMVAVVCKTYQFSMAAVYDRHHRELAAKGYIAPDKTKDRPTKAGR